MHRANIPTKSNIRRTVYAYARKQLREMEINSTIYTLCLQNLLRDTETSNIFNFHEKITSFIKNKFS